MQVVILRMALVVVSNELGHTTLLHSSHHVRALLHGAWVLANVVAPIHHNLLAVARMVLAVACIARFLLVDRVVVAEVRIGGDHPRQILVVNQGWASRSTKFLSR